MTAETATTTEPAGRSRGRQMLALGALGVVFGDIGTSVLYALQTVFTADGGAVEASPVNVYGVLSLVFWSLVLIVSVEFVILIMRADNAGEGGIMALIALVKRQKFTRPWVKPLLVTAGLFGVALFFGDGMITPAISVLSAVEGLEVAAPDLAHLVIPITIAVLVALFAVQRFGTSSIGRVFGPVMLVWFAILALTGGIQLAKDPAMLRSLSPGYAVEFLTRHPLIAFIALGSVVLTITGTEALYADMGHFGRPAITRAWFWVVFPALLLNYMGQGSLILEQPSAVQNPFFLLMPAWAQLPMVVLATVATVIASQAVISGAFSVTNQAIRAKFLPRMNIRHTSNTEIGQVYSPAVNWALLIAVIALVLAFRSSSALASAYGIAVTGTLLIDTVLFLVVMRLVWKRSVWVIALAGIVFLTVNALFLGANLPKVTDGGYLPLGVGVVVFALLATWYRGQARVTEKRIAREGSLEDFVESLTSGRLPIARVPGTAVHLSLTGESTPLALRTNAESMHSIHEHVVILSMSLSSVSHVPEAERLTVERACETPDIVVLRGRLGFRDRIDAPAALRAARDQGLLPDLDVDGAVYVSSHITIKPDGTPGMAGWRKRLFSVMTRNATSAVDYFNLPPERTYTIGMEIPV